ncbi:MAG TPA: hypothetical protein VE377_13160 [Candidatus Dormibacteraeota bacterium]|nr:hypothetical protein [Candidatus Dormibacteraeota bacterium]
MTAGENIVDTVLILLAPIGMLYAWLFFLMRMRHEPGNWRNRISMVSLVLIFLAALSWLIMASLMPRADWGSGIGVGLQAEWVEAWHRPIFRTLLAALVLCLFGRPRLILPLAVACIGTALFWLFSTMP